MKEDPRFFTKRYELLRLGFIILNLSWIYYKRKIVTGNHSGLFVSPNFLDLASNPVPLHGIAKMTNRNYDYSIQIKLIFGNNHFHAITSLCLAGLKNLVDLRLSLYDFLLSKVSSHHRR